MASPTRPGYSRISRQQDHSYQRNRFQRYCLSTNAPLWHDKGPEVYESDFGEHKGSPVYSLYPSIVEAFDESVLGNMIDNRDDLPTTIPVLSD